MPYLGMVELMTEQKELPGKFKIAFLIGRGSRLTNILEKILTPESPVKVTIVVSHRKPKEDQEDVPGIQEAKKRGIQAVYWNLKQMYAVNKSTFGDSDGTEYRAGYMRTLGAFLSQQYYRANLVFMTGWDLVLDDNFANFFQKQGVPILNVHPHPLPDVDQPQNEIVAPDGTTIPVLRGTEVWIKAIEDKLAWSGVTIHQVISREYDVGPVVAREWVKIDTGDTVETLREKLNVVEDRIVPETILKIQKGEVTLT